MSQAIRRSTALTSRAGLPDPVSGRRLRALAIALVVACGVVTWTRAHASTAPAPACDSGRGACPAHKLP